MERKRCKVGLNKINASKKKTSISEFYKAKARNMVIRKMLYKYTRADSIKKIKRLKHLKWRLKKSNRYRLLNATKPEITKRAGDGTGIRNGRR